MEHFRLMWRRRWFIAAVSLAVAAGVFALSRARAAVYEAEAVLDVIPETVQPTDTVRESVEVATARFAALAETTSILRAGVRLSGLNITVDTARERVSASEASTLGFVDVRARGPSPATAEALADGVVEALEADARRSVADVPEDERPPLPRVVSPAQASDDPIEPTPARDAVLAFLVALVLTAEGAALVGTISGRLPTGRVRDEVERVTDARVLARIPGKGREELVEAFRELRAQVEFARADADIRSVVVTAVDPGDGASFVARGLAQVAANLKASVVLIDANLRRPSVATEMKLPPMPGLGDLLLGAPLEPGLLRQANPLQKRFRVLTAGLAVPDAPGLLGGGALRKLVDQITDAEIVVVDAPAVTEAADALVIAAQVDASILVVDARRTRRRTLNDGVRRLTPHARLLGSVINQDEPGSQPGRRFP
jgi:polysaccharide biosynthesis transport protein